MDLPNDIKYAKRGGRAPKVASPRGNGRSTSKDKGRFPNRPPPGEGGLIPANHGVPERRDDTIIEEVAESCLYLSHLIPIVGESKGMTLGQYRKLNAQLEAFIKTIDDGCKAEYQSERGIR